MFKLLDASILSRIVDDFLNGVNNPLTSFSTGVRLVVTVVEVGECGEVGLHVLDIKGFDDRLHVILVGRFVD